MRTQRALSSMFSALLNLQNKKDKWDSVPIISKMFRDLLIYYFYNKHFLGTVGAENAGWVDYWGHFLIFNLWRGVQLIDNSNN